MLELIFALWEGRLPTVGLLRMRTAGVWKGMSCPCTPASSSPHSARSPSPVCVPCHGATARGDRVWRGKRDGAHLGQAVLSLQSQSQAEL